VLNDYEDIRSRIKEEPRWWDEYGVPRYCDPSPRHLADIYAREAAFAEIACQSCGERFVVAFSRSSLRNQIDGSKTLAEQIADDTIHYGDPPNTGCCLGGATMNSEFIRVLSLWIRDHNQTPSWRRVEPLPAPAPESKEG
jgi:hypothetical protein